MNIIKKGLIKTIKLLSFVFYNYTFEFTLFAFTLLTARIVQIEYKIQDFNYFLILALFFAALFLDILFKKLSIKKNQKFIAAAVLMCIAILVVINNHKEIAIEVKKLQIVFEGINEAFYNSTPTNFNQFAVFLIAAVPFFVLIMLYLERKGLGNILILGSLIYICNFWYAGELFEIRVYMILYMLLCSLIFCMTKFNKLLSKYKNSNIKVMLDRNRIINYFLVVSIIASVFSYVLVNKVNSKSLVASISEKLLKSDKALKSISANSYEASYSGYAGSSSKLGGSVKLNSELAFKIKAEETYYLKGSVKDYYNGFSWSRRKLDYRRRAGEPLRELTSSFYEHMVGTGKKGNLERGNITIYPERAISSYLFAPSFTYNIDVPSGQVAYDDTGSYAVVGSSGEKNGYSIDFYKSSVGLENFNKLFANNIDLDYSALEQDENMKEKYTKYLQVPDNISIKVHELVESITKEAKTNGEKVKKIQEYLTKNYRYSLVVGDIPEGKEFIEHFLFTEQKGYCTYFATASAIMFRIAGIPSRYVEGFAMKELRDDDDLYLVTNEMAHVWTEILVYPEDDIWTIAECTPSSQGPSAYPSMPAQVKNTNANAVPKSNGGIYILYQVLRYGAYSLLVLLVISIVWIISKIVIWKLKVRKAIKSNSSAPLYGLIRKRLRCMEVGAADVEDDYVWLEQIEDTKLREVAGNLIDGVYRELYRKSYDYEINKKQMYKTVEKSIRLKQNLLKYYFYKIFKS
jgi:hypothetical protein